MKKIQLFNILLFVCVNSFTQIGNNSFKEFCTYFNTSEKHTIPLQLSQIILGYKIMGTSEYTEVSPEMLFSFDSIIIALIKIDFVSEIEISNYTIVEFGSNGDLKRSDILGYNLLDFDNKEFTSCFMVNDSLLEVRENNDSSEDYTYFRISNNGYERYKIESIFLRPNTKTSTHILKRDELKELSKMELDMMRNEIFADHGYIFKTQKWKDYFSDKSWYTPRYDNVNDKLSIIEKINIQTILEVSKNK